VWILNHFLKLSPILLFLPGGSSKMVIYNGSLCSACSVSTLFFVNKDTYPRLEFIYAVRFSFHTNLELGACSIFFQLTVIQS
jgi:hypothetical protein